MSDPVVGGGLALGAVQLACATLRNATPLLYAAAGGCVSERGGIVNIALEGLILGGAYAAILGAQAGGAVAGVLAGLAAGLAIAGLHALVTVRFGVNQIVSGVGINLGVAGLTRLLLSLQFGSASQSGRIDAASVPVILGDFGGVDVLVLGALAAPLVAHFLLEKTRFGLRLRAAGEHPQAARSLGISVGRVRTAGVLVSGALAALGGVALAYKNHQFVADFSNGRGFMALAAVIFGAWRPRRALLACLLFGGLEALSNTLQARFESLRAYQDFVMVLPYLATLVVLAVTASKARAPAALGRE